jgi:acyl-CoA synthetase (NDP forming)
VGDAPKVKGLVQAAVDEGADPKAVLQEETVRRLGELNTHGLVDTRTSFLDLTPMTDDVGYAKFIEAVLRDENVDCMFVAVVPHIENLKTLEHDYLDADAVFPLIAEVAARYDKPIVVSVNSGSHYQHAVAYLEEHGLPVYGNIHAAIRSLDKFVEYWIGRKA